MTGRPVDQLSKFADWYRYCMRLGYLEEDAVRHRGLDGVIKLYREYLVDFPPKDEANAQEMDLDPAPTTPAGSL